jgi:hypothetical protein
LMGHRGRWVSERRWGEDDMVARLRATGDATFVDEVLTGVASRSARWTFTLHDGSYEIETDQGEHLDDGRYRITRGSIELTPWDRSGIVLMAPSIDAGRARFEVITDTTAPTRGVPDEVFLRLLLGSDSFAWAGAGGRSSARL